MHFRKLEKINLTFKIAYINIPGAELKKCFGLHVDRKVAVVVTTLPAIL